MSDKKLNLEIITPEGKIFSHEVDMAVIPGTEGDLGILPGHISLISTVRPGLLITYHGDNISNNIFISEGFAEIYNDHCVVLVENAVDTDKLDKSDIINHVNDLNKAIAISESDEEILELKAKVSVFQAILERVNLH
ncbi:ATP synthase subunit epsilon [Rickettsiales bacterium Ac37b]|nr:ATP synthase subunit epsilon [Rickettsiales bacterium Ac37b]